LYEFPITTGGGGGVFFFDLCSVSQFSLFSRFARWRAPVPAAINFWINSRRYPNLSAVCQVNTKRFLVRRCGAVDLFEVDYSCPVKEVKSIVIFSFQVALPTGASSDAFFLVW
jgi:hypothetical protein